MPTEKPPIYIMHLRIGYVIAFTCLIYLTIPFARDVEGFLRNLNILRTAVYMAIAVFISVGALLILRYAGFRLLNVIILIIFIILYLLVMKQYPIIVEKIHFLEYGFLAFLVYYLLKSRISGRIIYPVSLLIVIIIGWGDELIQYHLPSRVYDNRDVFLNALSGALILGLIYVVEAVKGKELYCSKILR